MLSIISTPCSVTGVPPRQPQSKLWPCQPVPDHHRQDGQASSHDVRASPPLAAAVSRQNPAELFVVVVVVQKCAARMQSDDQTSTSGDRSGELSREYSSKETTQQVELPATPRRGREPRRLRLVKVRCILVEGGDGAAYAMPLPDRTRVQSLIDNAELLEQGRESWTAVATSPSTCCRRKSFSGSWLRISSSSRLGSRCSGCRCSFDNGVDQQAERAGAGEVHRVRGAGATCARQVWAPDRDVEDLAG